MGIHPPRCAAVSCSPVKPDGFPHDGSSLPLDPTLIFPCTIGLLHAPSLQAAFGTHVAAYPPPERGQGGIPGLSPVAGTCFPPGAGPFDTLSAFEARLWPGNVREPESVVERAVITGRGGEL